LYPDLTDEELLEVEETLDRYLEIVGRIAERAEIVMESNPAPDSLAA
jgi:hypothetical protein